jgi:hypothetical protein
MPKQNNQALKIQLLFEAAKHGTITFMSRDNAIGVSRYLVTMGNTSVPVDLTDALWKALPELVDRES